MQLERGLLDKLPRFRMQSVASCHLLWRAEHSEGVIQMGDDKEFELARYNSQLRREEAHWQHLNEVIEQSDGFAVSIGLVTLRTSIVLNAGALVALLAFAGRLIDKKSDVAAQVVGHADWYLAGLFLAMAGAAVAYFYQSVVTRSAHEDRKRVSRLDLPDAGETWDIASRLLALVMVLSVVASLVVFGVASYLVFEALRVGLAT